MTRFIGLDLHKQSLEIFALDARGKLLFRQTVTCQRPALEWSRRSLPVSQR
jgi:hypothetical protein